MLKKLIVVYNPRSSRHAAVEQEVLAPARELAGWLVGKYEVRATGLDENAEALAKVLNDGDLVIAAGGDGTAAMAVNGVMQSGKDVALGVLGYGNFNDVARMLGAKRAVEYGGEYVGGVSEIIAKFEAGKTREIYPLEAVVDGKHWRYAPCYLSIGLLAESTAVFDEPKVREKLKKGKGRLVFSVWTLAKWYFRNRKKGFLPEGATLEASVFSKSVDVTAGRQKVGRAEASVILETVDVTAGQQKLVSGRKSSSDVTELTFAKQIPDNAGTSDVSQNVDASVEQVVTRQTSSDADSSNDSLKSNASAKQVSDDANVSKVSSTKRKAVAEKAKAGKSGKKVDAKLKREAEAVKHERNAEQKKFKRLMKTARKQQLAEMGAEVRARAAVASAEMRAKIVNAKIKAEDRAAAKKRARAVKPEIVIEGIEVVEKRKREGKVVAKKDFEVLEITVEASRDAVNAAKKDSKDAGKKAKVEKSVNKSVACAVEKAEKNRMKKGATDYIAVNGPTLARMMKGGRYYRKAAVFRSTTVRLSGVFGLGWFMLRSILLRVPGRKTRGDVIRFAERGDVMIQAEGEYEKLEGVKKIVVRKAKRGVRVVG